MTAIVKEADARGPLDNGRHPAGESLWLVARGDSRSWVVRWLGRDFSIGSIKKFSLSVARDEAEKILGQLRNGVDPTAEKRKTKEAEMRRKTFAEAAQEVIETRREGWQVSELRGDKSTLLQWQHDMTVVTEPIADKGVDLIDRDDIKALVLPIIKAGHLARAKGLLGRIEMVLEFAIKEGWRTADNVAAWRRVDHLFPPKPERKRHHASLPFTDVPAFIQRLRGSDAVSARIVELIALTGTRSQEARGARWSEIDWERRVWTVPDTRMKKRLKHEVPLSGPALALLEGMKAKRKDDGAFVFPGGRGTAQTNAIAMSHQSTWKIVQRWTGADADATVHGFRSSFMIWAKTNGVDLHLAERCLAHDDGDATSQAYGGIQRDQLTEKRRPVMEAWGAFIQGETPDNVVPLRRIA